MGTMHINNWVYVARALRRRGYDVSLVVWNPPAHEVGAVPYDIVLAQRFPSVFRLLPARYFFSFVLFVWALWSFDVFITTFAGRLLDRTLYARWFELPLLRLAGKPVILNTYGADVMTPRLTLGRSHRHSVLNGYMADPTYATLDERAIARNRNHCERWASLIVSAIDHVEYLQRVDCYLHMRCIDTARLAPSYVTDNRVPVIVHAPNHRALKGTDYLVAAVAALRTEGVACELVILERRPHREVLEAIAACDVVADQFLVGAYARLAIEAMALGKPVLCYLRPDLFKYNPIWRECPIINADPDTLKDRLRELLLMTPAERAEIGRRGRQYIERFHSLEYIGKRLDEIIMGLWRPGHVRSRRSDAGTEQWL
jgi:glycosyltransferase involved in cell wall biosynthesis